MTKKGIKSIILYLDSAEAIEYLTNEQTGILFKAVFRYARTGQKLESSDTALTALFTIMCAQIDRDHKKYEERCERNVANARQLRPFIKSSILSEWSSSVRILNIVSWGHPPR